MDSLLPDFVSPQPPAQPTPPAPAGQSPSTRQSQPISSLISSDPYVLSAAEAPMQDSSVPNISVREGGVPLHEETTSAGEGERRRYPRITGCFPALLRGVMNDGHRREQMAVLDSLGKGGLFLLTQATMAVGASVLVVFKLSSTSMGAGPRIAVRGKVKRIVPQQGGTAGVAVVFDRYRFIYNDRGGSSSAALHALTPINQLMA